MLEMGLKLPTIFITGHGDIPMSVEAMKTGAIEFLTKPFRDQDLLDAIQQGIALDRQRRALEGPGNRRCAPAGNRCRRASRTWSWAWCAAC
ncbi:MAGUK p55 subfamily member 4 [Manis javanica]|nr:MAGUK p55 subfamily member 4 [Manis javanica]